MPPCDAYITIVDRYWEPPLWRALVKNLLGHRMITKSCVESRDHKGLHVAAGGFRWGIE